MLRSSGISGAIILAILGVQTHAQPSAFNKTLGAADRVAASATTTWTKFDPTSDAYGKAMYALERSGVFNKPITLLIIEASFKTDEKSGDIVVEGVCQVRREALNMFRSQDEYRFIKKHKEYTRQIHNDFDLEMRTLASTAELGAGSNTAIKSKLRDKQWLAARVARRKSEHETALTQREHDRKILFSDLDMIAESRRKRLTPLRIHATIPAELAATVRLKKAIYMKQISVTMTVGSFELQAGNKEIKRPVSVGKLTGTALTVGPARRDAKKRGQRRKP